MSILNSTKTGLQRYAMYICNYEEFYKKTLVDCAFYDTQRAIIEMGKRQAKQQYIQQMDGPKEKYTATMDVSLRRSIKVFCAENGKMFSEFVEDACKEKLSREGGRF